MKVIVDCSKLIEALKAKKAELEKETKKLTDDDDAKFGPYAKGMEKYHEKCAAMYKSVTSRKELAAAEGKWPVKPIEPCDPFGYSSSTGRWITLKIAEIDKALLRLSLCSAPVIELKDKEPYLDLL